MENGSFNWKLDGQYHREDGPAVKYADGREFYFLNGKLHREDGPAVKHPDRTEYYYFNGKLHREDGPAVKWPDGTEVYYVNGKKYLKDDFYNEFIKHKKNVLACENREVIIEGVKYKLTKV